MASVPLALARPRGPLFWPLSAVALTAAYCLAYNALAGKPESLANALAWGALMVAPWVAAVDVGRRATGPRAIAGILLAAGAFSLLGEALLSPAIDWGFAMIRRLPGLAAAVLAIVGLRAWAAREARAAAPPARLDPGAVAGSDWIEAAGNYIAVHGPAGARLLRSPLSRAEAALAPEFVRVHRSLLVRRSAVAALDRGSLRLRCGKRLPVGGRYRAALAGRELVPSSPPD